MNHNPEDNLKDNRASLIDRFQAETDSGDKTVMNLLYFQKPFNQIPVKVLASTLGSLIWETFLICLTTLGSQIVVGTGYVLLNYMENTQGQAALGIATTYNLIFFYGFYLSMVDKIGIDCSQTFGAKQYRLTKKITNQGFWTCVLVYGCFTTPFFLLSKQILMIMQIDEETAEKSREILMLMMIPNYLEMFSDFLRVCSMAQGFEQIFGSTSLLTVLIAVISAWILVVPFDLGPAGWVYGKTIYELISLIVSLVIFSILHPSTKGYVSFKEVKQGFGHFFLECLKFASGSYLEFIAYEVTSIFVYMTQDKEQIAGYSGALNITTLFYAAGETFATICRTRMNLLIGKNMKNAAKKFYLFFLIGVFLFGGLIGGVFLLTRDIVSHLYAGASKREYYYFSNILTIYCFCIPNELSITTSFMGLKTIGNINFLLGLNILLLIGGNLVYCVIVTRYFNKGAIYLFAGLNTIFYFMNLVCVLRVAFTNWNTIMLVTDDSLADLSTQKSPRDKVVLEDSPLVHKLHNHLHDKEVTDVQNLVLY